MHRGPGNQVPGQAFQLLNGLQWVCDADNFLRPDPVFLVFFSVCLNLTNKPSVRNHQFSLSACHTVQSFNWESLVVIMPTCYLLLPWLPSKYPGTFRSSGCRSPHPTHSKHPDHGLPLCIIQWPDNQGKMYTDSQSAFNNQLHVC